MLWFDQLQSRLQDKDHLSEDDLSESIQQALNEYNGYFPKACTITIKSSGEKVYALPDNWLSGISQLQYLEYPLVDVLIVSNPNNYPIPAYRTTNDYKVCLIQNEPRLYLLFDIPKDEYFCISYTIHHTIDALESIPAHHSAAVLNLATSYILMKLASLYSQSIMVELQAEAVDFKSKSKMYQEQSGYYRDLWEKMMSIGKYLDQRNSNQFLNDDAYVSCPSSVSKRFTIDRRFRMFRPSYEGYSFRYNSTI